MKATQLLHDLDQSLRQPPTMYQGFDLKPNYCRMRISPDITIAVGTNVIAAEVDQSVSPPGGWQNPAVTS